jgi:hypothetical protein
MKCSRRSASKEKNVGLGYVSLLVYSGLAKSKPVTAKGVEGCTRSAGKGASTSCPRALLAIFHGKQASKTFLMFCRARRIKNSCLRWDSTTRRENGATGYGYGGSTSV